MGDWLQMVRVDAPPVPAQVVKFETGRHGADKQDVGYAMRAGWEVAVEVPVALWGNASGPVPAEARRLHLRPEAGGDATQGLRPLLCLAHLTKMGLHLSVASRGAGQNQPFQVLPLSGLASTHLVVPWTHTGA